MPDTVYAIKSDSSDQSYKVTVVDGTATACTCVASQQGLHCKHLYRAEVKAARVYESAIEGLVKEGVFVSTREAVQAFEELAHREGTNEALSRFIRLAYGYLHPLAKHH